MPTFRWKTSQKWETSFNFSSVTKHYSVELVRLKRWWGEECQVFTNGLQIHSVIFKRLNGLALCSNSETYSWTFDGRSFLLMIVPGLCSVAKHHLFIDGVEISTNDSRLSPSTLLRRRGWLLVCFGFIELVMGISLESICYIEDIDETWFLFWELLGRVLLIFGFLKIVEGLKSPVARYSDCHARVYTV
ncbi:uncharacterized protein LOC114964623 [Acropora millepora]|uniref:uncharacterized protein LOC114964623 n=1 Tax=Acropora millepora TaxID=45264 RepID=UPI001CF55B9B|nr:uncharacterized protein LOC114964623 [Acropora millepora]